jgi:hypothetical protein
MLNLGELAIAWSLQGFVLAAVVGFAFAYVLVARISTLDDWRPEVSARSYGVRAGVTAAWYLFLLGVSQALAGIYAGDELWPRIISRAFPYLVAGIATGLGVWLALSRKRKRGSNA